MGDRIPDGMIGIGSEAAGRLGFTADKFCGWLWKTGDAIYVSFVVSRQPGQGNFSALVDSILSNGCAVKVPTPLGKMRDILQHKGFSPSMEFDDELGEAVEVWCKQP
jgi:hypothetical protein